MVFNLKKKKILNEFANFFISNWKTKMTYIYSEYDLYMYNTIQQQHQKVIAQISQ